MFPKREMTEKANPTSMDPTMRSKRTDLKSLNVQTLVIAIHVFKSQDFRRQVAMRRRTEKVKKNLVLLNERPYTVEIFTSQILREIDFSIKIDFT